MPFQAFQICQEQSLGTPWVNSLAEYYLLCLGATFQKLTDLLSTSAQSQGYESSQPSSRILNHLRSLEMLKKSSCSKCERHGKEC